MKFCRGAEYLFIHFFGFWCASRDPTLTDVDLSSSFGKAGTRQQVYYIDCVSMVSTTKHQRERQPAALYLHLMLHLFVINLNLEIHN